MIATGNKGYDSRATKRDAVKPNGVLELLNGGPDSRVNLWVAEVSTGWGMTGSAAQSSRTRTFFAHNWQQPSFTVVCQFPSQQHMALAAQLVRRSHKGLDSSLLLEIYSASPVNEGNRKLKGVSEPIRAEGHVKSFARVHERHVYAPDVTFDFVIERLDSPNAWRDTPITVRRLKSWHDILEGVMTHDPDSGFVDEPRSVQRPMPKRRGWGGWGGSSWGRGG